MDNTDNHKKNSNLGIVMSQGEAVVKEVNKHPIGALLAMIVGLAVAMSVILTGIILFGIFKPTTEPSASYASILVFIGGILAFMIMVATLINIYLYRLNRLIVTTEKVAQIHYRTIIDRKVVQLSIERIQDVTVSQVGILPRIFKYGTLIIETAGEKEDCVFSFAPEPYQLAREIMDVHEKAVAKTMAGI